MVVVERFRTFDKAIRKFMEESKVHFKECKRHEFYLRPGEHRQLKRLLAEKEMLKRLRDERRT